MNFVSANVLVKWAPSETKVVTKSVKGTKAADEKNLVKRTKATDEKKPVKRNKATDEKTPEKRKSVKKISTSSRETTPLSLKENLNEYASPQTRYNLRSRGSTPAQSPNVSIMSPVQQKYLVDAVSKKLQNKLPISSRI
ncbi:hypothetical protein AVEN_227751-1 [Araneus ventricosus]|uniref:Uncharacterized protein n=1 Tax=Araneus ventricosus TaxID=182803 RepID=A0A4Y2LQ19_ARAVE|nr:hypothetical protein AVEN_227751-1 [Araneus ventricosus]